MNVSAILAFAAAMLTGVANGQETTAPPVTVGRPEQATAARMLTARVPAYPLAPRMQGQEGWVVLSFVVSPEGTVVDPIVEDSSGQKHFEAAALKAAADQRYSPATVNGKPVEQCATQVRYVFSIPDMADAARREFRPQYQKVLDLNAKGDRTAAIAKVDELLKSGTWNHYEANRLHLLRAQVCREMEDLDCMLNSLTRALSSSDKSLETSLQRVALEELARVQLRLEHYGDALATIQRRTAMKPPLPDDDPLLQADRHVRDSIASDQVLGFSGTIGFRSGCDLGEPNWRHQLLRREFAVDALEGRADRLEIRCDWRRAKDSISPDKVWKVPATWGNCVVFVFGEQGARIKLVEYPLEEKTAGNVALPAAVASD